MTANGWDVNLASGGEVLSEPFQRTSAAIFTNDPPPPMAQRHPPVLKEMALMCSLGIFPRKQMGLSGVVTVKSTGRVW